MAASTGLVTAELEVSLLTTRCACYDLFRVFSGPMFGHRTTGQAAAKTIGPSEPVGS